MTRALLVIDVQMEYFSGALPVSHPTGSLERILAAMDAAVERGAPVAVIQHRAASPQAPVFATGGPGVGATPRGGASPEKRIDQQALTRIIQRHRPGRMAAEKVDADMVVPSAAT